MAAALSLRPLGDVDFWWQHATGRWIVEHGISATEVFTTTRAGTPRVESSWLYCVVLLLLAGWIGASGLVILKTALVLLALWIAACARQLRPPPPIVLLACGLAIYGAQMRFAVRPELLSSLLMLVFLVVLERAREATWRSLLALFVAQALWVNLHSLFAIGPAIVGAWTLEALAVRRQNCGRRTAEFGRRCGVLAAVLVACLLNPYGTAALRVPLHQLATILQAAGPSAVWAGVGAALVTGAVLTLGRRVQAPSGGFGVWPRRLALGAGVLAATLAGGAIALAPREAAGLIRRVSERVATPDGLYVVELRSPFDPLIVGSHVWAGAALVVLTGVALVLRPRRQALHRVLLFGALLVLTLLAVRNIGLLMLCSLFIVSRSFPSIAPEGVGERRPLRGLAKAGLSTLTSAAALAIAWGAQTNRLYLHERWPMESGLGVAAAEDFSETADFLEGAGLREGFFNTHGVGSFLIDRGMRVFIDSRAVDGVLDETARIVSVPHLAEIDRVEARHGVRAFVVETRYLGLIGRLGAHERWRLAHAEPNAVVFLRADIAPEIPRLSLEDSWMRGVRERLPRVRSPEECGPFDRVSSPEPFLRVAWLCMMAGAYGQSRDMLEAALTVDPGHFKFYHALAYANAATVRFERAAAIYGIAIEREPTSVRLRLDAARCWLGVGDLARAEEQARQAERLAGATPEVSFVLGTVLLRQRQFDEAAGWLERAVGEGPAPSLHRVNLATALVALDRLEAALAQLELAAETSPRDPAIRRDLCRLLVRLGRHADAEPHLVALESIDPGDPALDELYGLVVLGR